MSSSHSPLDIFRLTFTAIIFVLTLFGNIGAILYIYKHKQLRSIKNYYYGYYLINLNVADLLVAVFCIPFTVVYYESNKWTFGWTFCKVMPTIQVMVVSASISTLATVARERYRAIMYPLSPRSTLLGLRIRIMLIWLWSLVVAAPSLYAYKYDKTRSLHQCHEAWPSHYQRQAYTTFLFLVNYALPLGFIITSYIIIVIQLKFGVSTYSEHATQMLQNRFIKLMALLISSFIICYLPGHICFFILDFGVIKNHLVFTNVLSFSHVLIWLNSCLNPFFYCALRGYLKELRSSSDNQSDENPVRQQILKRESLRRLLGREENTAIQNKSTCFEPSAEIDL